MKRDVESKEGKTLNLTGKDQFNNLIDCRSVRLSARFPCSPVSEFYSASLGILKRRE